MEKMKYFFFIFFTAVFIIPEPIEGMDKYERIWNLKKSMKNLIQEIKTAENHPYNYADLIKNFKKTFERTIGQIDTGDLPIAYQQLINRYENIIEKLVQKLETDLHSISFKIVKPGKCIELMRNFRNNIAESLYELDKVELYPGNYYELERHFRQNLDTIFERNGIYMDTYYVHQCLWHYRKMKYNDNTECKFEKMMGVAYVHLPTSDDYEDDKWIQGELSRCNCWELNNKQMKEYVFVIENASAKEEYVFTYWNITQRSTYILKLQSGWENIKF